MSRSTQFLGLNDNGADLIEEYAHKEEYDQVYGMFDEPYPLYRYYFRDGNIYSEAVQEEIWDCGPMIYVALKDFSGNWVDGSLWKLPEIKEGFDHA